MEGAKRERYEGDEGKDGKEGGGGLRGKDQREKEVVRGEHIKEEDKEIKWRKSGIWRKGRRRGEGNLRNGRDQEWNWGEEGRRGGEGGI
ncbi:hypothetical protein RF55_15672 [Lasius niger]|uniref:Uncharacterized protein n=1 Tax=Lasius niger TaxID=67767 RepID=A0A0J7K5M5_LASNI|nr:hypothetical protein RF55_15672 [Lasius niger]